MNLIKFFLINTLLGAMLMTITEASAFKMPLFVETIMQHPTTKQLADIVKKYETTSVLVGSFGALLLTHNILIPKLPGGEKVRDFFFPVEHEYVMTFLMGFIPPILYGLRKTKVLNVGKHYNQNTKILTACYALGKTLSLIDYYMFNGNTKKSWKENGLRTEKIIDQSIGTFRATSLLFIGAMLHKYGM